MIDQVLLQIGLSDKEVKLYLTSLRYGSQPASVLAKHAKINRSTVYDIFEGLIQKGLATKVTKGPTTFFQISDPQRLADYLERDRHEFNRKIERQKKEVENILPALLSIENPASTKPKVQFFEGEKGMREAYEQTLKSTEPIRAYANVEDMHRGLTGFFPDYYERRTKEGIHIRCIAPDNKAGKERHQQDKKEIRQMKLIPASEYSFSPETNIYDDKVLIASWKEKMAVMIQSQEIADFHKMMYDLLWEKLS